MSDPVILVENLSKRYRLGEREQYGALRDAMSTAMTTSWRRLRKAGQPLPGDRQNPSEQDLWAIRDVSFEIQRGEIIGIIGHNGAGKSTLLKILSRITKPTTGQAKIRGRVGSLLEVGTGFHPELTGRENIYMNGAILGMGKAEIERKFDEIVAFAEMGEFLDTPVKRYSSGMYMRLAFAVAAHLETEIVMVDEVLAVGDVAFQRKCLGKMGDVVNEGRTVLFVSHNMNAIQRLCPQSMLLERGSLVAFGDTPGILRNYLPESRRGENPSSWIDVSQMSRRGTKEAQVMSVWYSSDNNDVNLGPYPLGPLEFKLEIVSDSPRRLGSLAVSLYDKNGTKLINADTVLLGQTIQLQQGRNTVRVRISELRLNPGEYSCGWWLANPMGKVYDFVDAGFNIEVMDLELNKLGARPAYDGAVPCQFEVFEESYSS
jgi:ABC-type polysaccharide/polyol phosphate transport system ATPase subunit